MAPRKSITKKLRFEVFKRDSFKCQYCGRTAPDVVLNVDHIKPVAEGGDNDITNLITSCFDCNMGKKDRLLDDQSMLEKQRKQLEELNERRQQLEMMMEWREGLMALEEDKVNFIAEKWSAALNHQFSLNENGMKTVRKLLKKYEFNDILDSIESATSQYLVMKDNKYTESSVNEAWKMVNRISAVKKQTKSKPYMKDLYYMRGILKNRLHYYNPHETIKLLEKAYLLGASLESMSNFVKNVRNWTSFSSEMERFIEEQESKVDEDES